MDTEISSLKKFFEASNIVLNDEWLHSCVNWLKDGATLTTQELHAQVYEQWLLLDFADIQVPVLPPNIVREKKCVLQKSICLQVLSVVDISKPKLVQIMNMRKSIVHDHKSDDNQNGKRVLQLTLTDGVQKIMATEYKPVPALSLNLTPGSKVCLNAPIMVRRGQVMMEPAGIKVLGGEVDGLLISNAAENILAGMLGLEINPNPLNVDATFEDADKEIISGNTTSNVNETGVQSNIANRNYAASGSDSNNSRRVTSENKTKKQATTADAFEEDFDPDEYAELMALDDSPPRESVSRPTINRNNTANRVVNQNQAMATDAFQEDFDEEEYAELMAMDEPPPPQSVAKPTKKTMTLEKLSSLVGKVNRGIFKIRAKFNSVTEKLSMGDDSYSIKILLEDDTSRAVFSLHSDVVCELMGCSPRAFTSLKDEVIALDPVAISSLHSALEQFKRNLLDLDTEMEVLVEAGRDEPTIIKLL